jgi:hypothetical protein
MSAPEDLSMEVPPLSKKDIEKLATAYLHRKAPERISTPGPFPVHQAWDDIPDDFKGVIAGVGELPPGEEGRCDSNNRVYISPDIYEKMLNGDGRSRFTVLHEIFHVWRHREYIRRMIKGNRHQALYRRKSEVRAYRDPEWQANQFAGRVLVPTAAAVKLSEANAVTLHLVSAMMSTFQVSRQAAEVRLSQLKQEGYLS